MSDSGPVLVTGAAGFLGSHVVDRLLADGCSVEAIDDLSRGSLTNLEDARQSGRMRFHQIDVRAPEFVDLVERFCPVSIIHLAGHVDRPGSLLDPVFDADVNILGTLNVLESVRAHDIAKFAVAVQGLFCREEESGQLIVGQEQVAPRHISAGAVVDYVRVHGDIYGLDVRVAALASVYGPRQRAGTHGPVIARFVAAALDGKDLELHGGGHQARDFLYVDDAVDGIVRSLDLDSGSVVAIGTGVTTTIGSVAKMVIEGSGADVRTRDMPARPGDRPGIGFPTEDAARRLNWRSWTALPDGIATIQAAPNPHLSP